MPRQCEQHKYGAVLVLFLTSCSIHKFSSTTIDFFLRFSSLFPQHNFSNICPFLRFIIYLFVCLSVCLFVASKQASGSAKFDGIFSCISCNFEEALRVTLRERDMAYSPLPPFPYYTCPRLYFYPLLPIASSFLLHCVPFCNFLMLSLFSSLPFVSPLPYLAPFIFSFLLFSYFPSS